MSIEKIITSLQTLADKPVMRFAPSPNGNATLGHLKGLVILDQLRKLTGGKLFLRFDDTNPLESYKPEYYESILALARNLNINFDKIDRSSDRPEFYREAVEKLLSLEKAFFCYCKKNQVKFHQEICKCFESKSDLTPLIDKPQGVCVKFKSSLGLPYVIYRVIEDNWCPTIALQGPVDDFLSQINVIFRGRDLESLSYRQKEIHELLYSTPYPLNFYWGRISLWSSKTNKKWELSKSLLKDKSGFPSLQFFIKWGVNYEVLRKFILSYGVTKNDIKVDLIKLFYYQVGHIKTQSKLGNLNKNYIFWPTKGVRVGYKLGPIILSYDDGYFYKKKRT